MPQISGSRVFFWLYDYKAKCLQFELNREILPVFTIRGLIQNLIEWEK